jgi:signal peptidase I
MREEHMNDNNRKDDELEVMDLNDFGEPVTEKDEDKEPKNTRKKDEKSETVTNVKKEVLSWVMTFAIAFVLAFVLKNYVIINASVPTGSMQNTIQPKDKLFGSRLAYLKEGPERGDIIFFYYPDDESQKYVKRVIGLPGEKVTIREGKVYINDSETPLDEPYLKEEWVRGTGPYEFIVPEDGYFCMGDNRNGSHDARYWVNTYVMRDKIIGEALYIYYPFEHMGTLE